MSVSLKPMVGAGDDSPKSLIKTTAITMAFALAIVATTFYVFGKRIV